MSQTYQEIERILTAKNSLIGKMERILLAQNIMHQAAYPDDIDQGRYGACGSSASSEVIFRKHPELAATMIADAVLNGEREAPDGDNDVPLIVAVDANKKSFSGGAGDGSAGRGGHIVSISQYNQAHKMVKLSNQWGRDADRWVTDVANDSVTSNSVSPDCRKRSRKWLTHSGWVVQGSNLVFQVINDLLCCLLIQLSELF